MQINTHAFLHLMYEAQLKYPLDSKNVLNNLHLH